MESQATVADHQRANYSVEMGVLDDTGNLSLNLMNSSSRGRDLLSNLKEFAEMFGCSVTVESKACDMVAKRGVQSIFAAFSCMFPEVCMK